MPHPACVPALARPLEPTGPELRALLHAAVEHVVEQVDRVRTAAAIDRSGVADLLADPAVRRPPPEQGRAVDELLAVLERAAAKGINSASGGVFAYVPGSGLVSAAVADLARAMIIAPDRSIPVAEPCSARRAASRVVEPVPHPTSRTWSPGRIAAAAKNAAS
ncbi:hypothetical protein GCM10023320_75820 [Pseudonocardia adelaidensis]|uniref:Aspartate aminotransferase family protein n=1 Tax=Pseudonocardia adelaidensis TaxID=648754 RepID=A0ABP9P2U0_9PSEU